jgi:hypothetical protein
MSCDLGIGLAQIKEEGKPILYSGTEDEVGNDHGTWMELRLSHTLTRAEVHKLVDEWLEEAKWPN